MRALILLVVFCLGMTGVFAQNDPQEPINDQPRTTTPKPSELSFQNEKVWQNGVKLTPSEVRGVMAGNQEALNLYNSGRTLYVVGQVFAYPSAFFLGFSLGSLLWGNFNPILLGGGAVGMAVGLVMIYTGMPKINASVQLYNSKLNGAASYQVNFGITQMGVGLSMRF